MCRLTALAKKNALPFGRQAGALMLFDESSCRHLCCFRIEWCRKWSNADWNGFVSLTYKFQFMKAMAR
jgi:hypothetical protein